MQLNKILCAVDLTEHSKQVAEIAAMLAKSTGSRLIIIYVVPSLNHISLVSQATADKFVDEVMSGAEKAIETFVAENFAGLQVTAKVIVGYAAEEIIAHADQERVDMIVMGTHGRKGLDRILFGSVAEKVVRNAQQPVLTIRPAR